MVIADAHLGQRAGDVEEMVALVRSLPGEGFGELVYLGDVFQYLIGMEKFWTVGVRRVLWAWAEARAAGVRVVLVEGNRDFFLDAPDIAEHRDRSAAVYEVEAGGVRFRMVHGDTVNRSDLNYRFWRAVSKSRVARGWARLLPRGIARSIVASMERRLAATNFRFRYRKPVRALERAARRAWSEGVDVLLWGHFHTAWEIAEGGRRALVVPAWLETGLAVVIEPDGSWRLVPTGPRPDGVGGEGTAAAR